MPWVTDVHMSDVDGLPLGDYHLTRELLYEDWTGRLWVTPENSESDLSSFPWFVRVFLPKTTLAKAPWLHDFGYREQPTKEEVLAILESYVGNFGNYPAMEEAFDSLPDGVISRKLWDHLYLQGSIDEGMTERRAKMLYRGLRIGGGISWRMNAKKKKSKMTEELKKR